ncbi:hypothetical protein PYCCODRAFT_402089 [Trametes coccinea BRFM310]|uniref:Uncharacterized protein n=1 Tax=Trametes coccinea (strain BRFM310) TaxID=1353009 RepID=A0A1Y2IMU3_TRAC3|nr:hypothetical protein PYCCODRAFT_402089 [Trametes coccinea BRFM310]
MTGTPPVYVAQKPSTMFHARITTNAALHMCIARNDSGQRKGTVCASRNECYTRRQCLHEINQRPTSISQVTLLELRRIARYIGIEGHSSAQHTNATIRENTRGLRPRDVCSVLFRICMIFWSALSALKVGSTRKSQGPQAYKRTWVRCRP